MKLYTGPISVFGVKAEMAAIEKGLQLEVELVPFSIAQGYEPRHPEVTRINPKRQVPVLVDGELEIFDSTQIFEYFEHLAPQPALWPPEPKARAAARLLELQVDEVLFPNIAQLFPANRATASDEQVATATAAINACYARWDAQLQAGGPYLCGALSYADLALLPAQFMAETLGARLQPEHAALTQWRERMLDRPSARPLGRAWTFIKDAGASVPA